MKKLLRRILLRPVLWATNKFSSNPDRQKVFKALTDLLNSIIALKEDKGLIIPFDADKDRFVIFSDMHKGGRDGADDFMICEPAYLAALDYYALANYHYIALGDCEELWENTLMTVKRNQQPSFAKEKVFVDNKKLTKIFGNHDLYWQNDPFAFVQLKDIFGAAVPIYEGVLLQTTINNKQLNVYCTHGHQGDTVSDGNWFSKFFVSNIWAPLQSYLGINPNTPAYDSYLKTMHNTLMYDWSAAQQNLFLITGHTHQPVFASLTYIERLYRELLFARQAKDEKRVEALQKEITLRRFEFNHVSEDYLSLKSTYFNSGCCCYNDGDITGIELEGGYLRLIKWHSKEGMPQRIVLEEARLVDLMPATPDAVLK